MAHGDYTHVEIPADDVERAQRFYRELLGLEFSTDENFPDYYMFQATDDENRGGAIGRRGETAGVVLRVYFDVDSLDAALGRIEELGGEVVVPRTEVPGMGAYAAVHDSEGNEIALFENTG